ncbi:hypothetical protein [Paenibacillus alvei]|uniref:hypothetical protein n=1 Tax=Paenibacillus alvei TaxID=44250 RepID=UPI0013DD24B2|nr:hypothetical protein [Paenibacillus alvei]NEZ40250.1 hypothetical protein [Paenibacillus alvei]
MEKDIVKVLYFLCSEGASRINSGEEKHVIYFNPLVSRKLKLPKDMALCINGALDIVEISKIDSMTIYIADPNGTILAGGDLKHFLMENIELGATGSTLEFTFSLNEDLKFTLYGFYEAKLQVNNSIVGETGFYLENTSGDVDG